MNLFPLPSLYGPSVWRLTELSLSCWFSFICQESLASLLSFAVECWAGCTTLLRLPDHHPSLADVLVVGCLSSALRNVGNSAEVGTGGACLSTFKISCSSPCWRFAAGRINYTSGISEFSNFLEAKGREEFNSFTGLIFRTIKFQDINPRYLFQVTQGERTSFCIHPSMNQASCGHPALASQCLSILCSQLLL